MYLRGYWEEQEGTGEASVECVRNDVTATYEPTTVTRVVRLQNQYMFCIDNTHVHVIDHDVRMWTSLDHLYFDQPTLGLSGDTQIAPRLGVQ